MDYAIFSPHPYQDLIINHQIDIMRCNIWAGMGMGKTVATLTALEDLFMAGAETRPALVLAPLRVAANTWPDEAVKWGICAISRCSRLLVMPKRALRRWRNQQRKRVHHQLR